MRIGFFGGTFDPPHRGHLAVATAALREFSLDRLLLVPTGQQPLKQIGPGAAFLDRLAMVELLCQDISSLRASSIDAPLPHGEPNFTIDTLSRLRDTLQLGDSIFVVAGADAFLDLRRWREPERLLASAEWIVVSRPGVQLESLDSLALTPDQQARVHILNSVHVPVSATEVRSRLREGLDCSEMLPSAVLDYIRAHHLYGT